MKKLLLFALIPFLMLLSACNGGSATSSSTAEYPSKPIKIVVGFSAGGGTDTVGRIIAQELPKYLNDANIVIENKPGGSGVVGMTEVINSKPDGYTLGFSPTGPLVLQTHYGQTTYEYNDAVPISQVNSVDYVLAVHKDAPWDDAESFIEDVKKNPGKYSVGSVGAGTLGELSLISLSQETGIEINTVPFAGGGPTRTALQAKDVDAIVINDDDIIPYAKENSDFKVLLNFGTKDFESHPELPKATDLGFDISANISYILYGPKELPTEIRDQIDEAVAKMLEDEAVLESLEKIGIPADYMNAEDRTKALEEEYNRYGPIIESAGLKG